MTSEYILFGGDGEAAMCCNRSVLTNWDAIPVFEFEVL